MTVAELIEWLKGQEQSAIVEVVVHKDVNDSGSYYCQGGTADTAEFDPAMHVEITDLRGNPLITPDKPY